MKLSRLREILDAETQAEYGVSLAEVKALRDMSAAERELAIENDPRLEGCLRYETDMFRRLRESMNGWAPIWGGIDQRQVALAASVWSTVSLQGALETIAESLSALSTERAMAQLALQTVDLPSSLLQLPELSSFLPRTLDLLRPEDLPFDKEAAKSDLEQTRRDLEFLRANPDPVAFQQCVRAALTDVTGLVVAEVDDPVVDRPQTGPRSLGPAMYLLAAMLFAAQNDPDELLENFLTWVLLACQVVGKAGDLV